MLEIDGVSSFSQMKAAWRSTILGAGILILVVFAVYWPAMRGEFVFDDSALVTENHMIQADNGLYRIWFTTESADCWPITYSALWFQWRMWGNHATGYHVVNIALHAADVVLVWVVLRRLKIPGAWAAALLFAIHPVNVATVAWISEQKNTISMLFYSISVLLYLKFDEQESWKWYVPSLIAFALALLSKTSIVTEPVVLLGLAWWKRGQISRKDLLRTVSFFVFSLAGACATVALQKSQMVQESAIATVGFPAHLASAGWAVWFYLYKTVLPLNLILIYPNWKVDATWWISYVPVVALIGVFGIFWWKRRSWGRPLLFSLGYFVVTLFPILGFFHQSYHVYSRVADQWLYCSIIGVLALFSAAAARIWREIDLPWRYCGEIVAAAVFLLLGMATWKRNAVFANQEMLWRDTIRKNPDAWVAYNNLGVLLGGEGKIDEAMQQFRQAIQVRNDYVDAYNNLGNDLVIKGKIDEAMADYQHALQLYPGSEDAQKHMAEVYWQQGNAREAIEHWYDALQDNPRSIDVLNNLAWALATADWRDGGNPPRAVEMAQLACQLTDYRQPIYLDTLAVAYSAAGEKEEAIATERKALELARSAGNDELARKIQGRLAQKAGG
jgi:protein O-mannosyl-transferase